MRKALLISGLMVVIGGCANSPTSPTAAIPPGSATSAPPTSPSPPPTTPIPGAPRIDVPGPTLIPGSPTITAGDTVEVTIQSSALTCFQNWDASAHCAQYNFAATADGALRATLRLPGPSRGYYNPELFLVSSDGAWQYMGNTWPEVQASIPVKNGLTYWIVILSYGPYPDTLRLTAELQ
jgi:hypothetical protein